MFRIGRAARTRMLAHGEFVCKSLTFPALWNRATASPALHINFSILRQGWVSSSFEYGAIFGQSEDGLDPGSEHPSFLLSLDTLDIARPVPGQSV